MEKLLRSPPFYLIFFFSPSGRLNQTGKGENGEEKGQNSLCQARELCQGCGALGGSGFSCPLWCGIGGCGEDPGALCSQKMLGAAALSCSPFILMCNFNLLFVWRSGGCFFVALPHPKTHFYGILRVGSGVCPFPAGSSIAPEVKI